MNFTRLKISLPVAGLLLLSACVTTGGQHVQNYQSAASNSLSATLPRNEVSTVLASGFYSVSARALTDVSVRQLGLEGMRGLATIDPEISIEEDGRQLSVLYAGREIAVIDEPLEGDNESWADAVYDVVQAVWPHSVDIAATTPERVYEAVFDAALSNLDIFSRYAGKKEAEGNRNRRDGYGGVDLILHKIDERFFVKKAGRSGPAYEAGVRNGDMLVRVDGENVIGKTVADVEALLRGPIQSEFSIEIERPDTGVLQKLYLWRALMIERTVWSRYEDGILRLRISGFNERTVSDVHEEVTDYVLMHGARFQGLILDLRGNPGGLLRKAVRVADLFISGGRIISTQGRHPDSREVYEADNIDVAKGRPIVVLLDGKSASASEIVAAALQDRERAVIVGSSSYGKGTVQSVQRLPNDGEITVTWSRLVAPSGYAFHGLGVRPSVCTSGVKDNLARGPALWEGSGLELMNNWRNVAIQDQKGRKTLRQTCPPDRVKKRIDTEVARNILWDKDLYKRFMRLTTIATIAQ